MLVEGQEGYIPGTSIHARLVRWLYGHGVDDAGVYGTRGTEATLELRDGTAAPITVLRSAGGAQQAFGRRFLLEGDRETIFLRALPRD